MKNNTAAADHKLEVELWLTLLSQYTRTITYPNISIIPDFVDILKNCEIDTIRKDGIIYPYAPVIPASHTFDFQFARTPLRVHPKLNIENCRDWYIKSREHRLHAWRLNDYAQYIALGYSEQSTRAFEHEVDYI